MNMNGIKKGLLVWAVMMTALLSGCATLTSQEENDPLEFLNRGVYSFNEQADKYVVEPVAKGYQAVTPQVVDDGISNFFSNLDDVVVVVNDVLQLKFNQAFSDVTRLLINSSVGILGFREVAAGMGYPKHNEDFGQTLGSYGLGTGPYVVLPLLGSSTLRDTAGLFVDAYIDPIQQLEESDTRWGVIALKGVDLRADLSATKDAVDGASLDSYEFMRSAYFQRRNYLIHDGNPPLEDFDDFEDDE